MEWLHRTERSAFVIRGLLTPAECSYLLSLTHGYQPSYVGGAVGSSRMAESIRKAETAFLFQARWKDAIHRNVTDRILKHTAALPTIPVFTRHLDGQSLHPLDARHLEFSQVTRYGARGHYKWHSDGTAGSCNATFAWVECRAYTAIVCRR